MFDPLLQEVVEAWPKLDQVGRESVRNMAQLMRERAERQRLLAEEKKEINRRPICRKTGS